MELVSRKCRPVDNGPFNTICYLIMKVLLCTLFLIWWIGLTTKSKSIGYERILINQQK